MSAIGSIGSDSESLLAQRLQNLRVSQSSADREAQRKAELEDALKAAGASADQLPDLEKQIQSAVQSTQPNGGDSTDRRAAIRDAIDSVLKKNGLDSAKFEAQMKAQHTGGHRHHRHGGATQAAGATQTSGPAQASGATDTKSAEPLSPADPAAAGTTSSFTNPVPLDVLA
jgi:hypothetical protein